MSQIRACRDDEQPTILSIVNAAAERYRGVIPPDRWHEPYMTHGQLQHEVDAGVRFWGYAREGDLVGVMGLQPVHDVHLIRHAYVLPTAQRLGVGTALLAHLRQRCEGRILIGTWASASWAIRFYERSGFARLPTDVATALLRTYWSVPERQVETSVVLESWC